MLARVVCAIALCALAASAVPITKVNESVERVQLEPSAQVDLRDWNRLGAPSALSKIKLVFGIKQQNTDKLYTIFKAVSDPQNPKYGQYLSRDEVDAITRPKAEHISTVTSWLQQNGVASFELLPSKDLIVAYVPVKVAESLLQVTFSVFEHRVRPDVKLVRAGHHYTVPLAVSRALDFVDNVHRFPNVRLNKHEKDTTFTAGEWQDACGSGCTGKITPEVLTQRYNVTAPSAINGTMSVAEFQGQFYAPSDLSNFLGACKIKEAKVDVVGPNTPTMPGIESTLDIQYIMGVAPGIPTTFWSLEAFSLYDWITAVANATNPPLVHSVSYGNDEAQNDPSYMKRTNVEFQKIGTRGISVLFASGDQGVWGRSGFFVFHPDFPAASPYITGVGATQFPGSTITQEITTKWSGGGFSKEFTPESWQEDAINGYFNSGVKLPASYLWNKKGAGYPDLATNGGANQPYCIMVNNFDQGVAGTSASCPTAAAMFALINDQRLSAGKPPLGFLNPFIYQTAKSNPAAFDDITQGNNGNGKEGFEAAKGWDPATGVGNPNYPELLKSAMAN
eukprot:TRINITY_DN28541_c0_g1_i1.p1 TRINITY_DN28541_c0_g1~~TRINITY_DN28541_c0_g1_i1.p1  ORF type:complete len:563 (+),score=202.08 TRINITY_DN28541_c0_g1_i1:121-1809(+)